ncbi:MAG: CopG family transcriptional regulator [Desulfobulbaceae bacterium]|nr:CopG family transcriptional regulator [Desulfobulbaceae bacterium]
MGTEKVREKNRKKQAESRRLIRVTISLDPQDYLAFERLGEKAHLTRSWLIRKAMREFLERAENGQTLCNL